MQPHLLSKRIVPVAVIDSVEDAVPLALALKQGGLPLIEVTLRTPAALACIHAIRQACPEISVGAGTIIDPDQVAAAIHAGAEFGVSPGTNPPVIEAAVEQGLFFVPGVMTPSDIEAAMGLGCRLLKFFPAEPAGGVPMLKALAGPYEPAGVKFIPLGGISPQNMPQYLALPCVAAVGGSWICERSLIRQRKWSEITGLAAAAISQANG